MSSYTGRSPQEAWKFFPSEYIVIFYVSYIITLSPHFLITICAFCGLMHTDQGMFRPDRGTKIMKNGKLTVGRLNAIRAFIRECFNGIAGKMLKEV